MSLPASVEVRLNDFVSELQQLLKAELLSVVLYGSAIRGDFVQGTSDVNLLIVLQRLGRAQRKILAEPVQRAWREARIEPMVLSWEEMRRSADVFPLTFRAIQRHYKIVYGQKDFVKQIFCHPEHLRLACEREAKTMVVRLRRLYLLRAGLRPALRETMVTNINPFLRLIRNALELTGKDPSEEVEQMLVLAQKHIKMPPDTLFRIWTLRFTDRPLEPEQLHQLFEDFLDCASGLAAYVDRLGS